MTKPTTSSCITCGKKFTKNVHNQQTCSSNCRKKRVHDWEKNERVRTPKQLQKKHRYMNSYHKKNKKRNNERSRKHHQKNKQKDNARSRKYQKEHREELSIKKNVNKKTPQILNICMKLVHINLCMVYQSVIFKVLDLF